MKLEGRVAIVTGGGSGIGRATALAFAAEGAKVVVADIMVDGSEETVKMIRDAKGEAVFVKVDVSQADQVKAMVDRTIEVFGRLDCAANNAGISPAPISISKCTEEAWDKVMDVNLKGVFLCMKFEVPRMLKGGGGSIVNTASMVGLVGDGGHPAYAASKHGVVGLTKTVAIMYGKTGIRVNAVCPGVIRTPMSERSFAEHPELRAASIGMAPMDRFAEPEEVAQAIVWLCTKDASFITGHALPVDGGYVVR